MPWNPEIYNQFKNIRFQPFYDLASLIQDVPGMKAIDLGCGTGEQTAILAKKFPDATFTGIDSSAEMLEKGRELEHDRLHFRIATTEQVISADETWDLIFSNAALQWSEQHTLLFPAIISKLRPGGQLAVQMPYQPGNTLNIILRTLAAEEPYCSMLNGWNRPSSVLTTDDYTQLFFDNGLQDLNISQKVYPIVADTHDALFNFISGSALIPYMERLDATQQQAFITAFKTRITAHYATLPAIYAFKRILLYARKNK